MWQWEASSVKASSGTPSRDPSFATLMFHCRTCHFIENFPKGKLEKCSCEYEVRSKCLTIAVLREWDLSIIYEQHPNTLDNVVLGMVVSGYSCIVLYKEVMSPSWRRDCVPDCILVFLSVALTKRTVSSIKVFIALSLSQALQKVQGTAS